MNLSRGERELLRYRFNLFLAAARRCSETTEKGRLLKHIYTAIVMTIGSVLEDDHLHEVSIQKYIDEIKSFGVITDNEINGPKELNS